MSLGLLGLLGQLFGCGAAPPDYHLPPQSKSPPVRCVPATIEAIQIRKISSPAINAVDTRAVARTSTGETIWYDYNRSLQSKDARLEEGHTLYLLLDEAGQAAGVGPDCPPALEGTVDSSFTG